jgi:hypothetical protein
MSPHEFLAAVLPPPGFGYYCTAELSSKRKQHVFTEDLGSIEAQAQQWLNAKQDVYFALATFNEAGSREAVNAEYLRSLFIDMDGYESKQAAAVALSGFLESTGLDAFGAPWIVASGGGLHCYWTFDKPVTVGIWKPVAERFKRLCKERGLTIDMTVTADAARVLRLPGTLNFKKKYPTPRPVRLLATAHPIDFDAFSAALEALQPAPVPAAVPARATLDLAGTRPSNAPSASAVKLIENTTTRFKNILKRTSEGSGCGQLAYFVENAAQEGMEPLWRGWLSQTKYCADGERAAIWLSQLHPYEPARMQEKLAAIKGPYPCIKFDSENPGICTECKHFGKITNPLMLGREAVVDTESKEVELVVDGAEENETEVIKVIRPTPPKGYMYGANGGVFTERIVEEADGTKRKQQVMLLPYDLFVVDLLHKDGEHIVHMVANRSGKAVDVLMQQRYAVSKDECLKTLAQQNVLSSFGSGNDKNLYEYVRACVEDASTQKQAIKIPAQYGWQEDGSFVYSGRVFFAHGGTRTMPMPDLTNVTRVTRGHGSLDGWRKMPEMLIKRGLFDHLAMGCIGFGAPLMRFTQMNALTFHAGSTDSGTGKSLALNLLNSIWGHPIRYRTGKGTSPVTMQQRMGNLNSLPFTSDEITHKSRQDMEWFPGFVFDASEGQGKEKSEAHHNRERINNVSWSTLVLLTSNTHMHDYMSGVRDHTSQGELLRMLEWIPEVKLNWTPDEEDAIKALWDNYGVAGEKYVRWLVQNEAVARDMTLKVIARLKKDWRMSGDERFWAAGCGAVVAGAILASSKYADIVNLPVEEIVNSLFRLVEKARKVVRTGARTAEDVLNAFIRDNYGGFVVLRVDPERRELLAHLGTGQAIDQSITRNKVMGRVEHQVSKVGHVEFFIEEQVIKAHCVAMSFGYDRFRQQIASTLGYAVQFMRKDMMARTKGPQMRVRVMSISRPVTPDDDFEILPVERG